VGVPSVAGHDALAGNRASDIDGPLREDRKWGDGVEETDCLGWETLDWPVRRLELGLGLVLNSSDMACGKDLCCSGSREMPPVDAVEGLGWDPSDPPRSPLVVASFAVRGGVVWMLEQGLRVVMDRGVVTERA
jgi:hypothetical protein